MTKRLDDERGGSTVPVPGTEGNSRMGRHYARYALGNLLVVATGLVSFPLLTRLLDNNEYGILGYYETWVTIAVAIAKMGTQHSIQRFYPFAGDSHRLRVFSTNMVMLPMMVSFALWLLVCAVLLLRQWLGHVPGSPALWLALAIIPPMVFSSNVQTVMRAQERSDVVLLVKVAARWLELIAMLAVIWFVSKTAISAYVGRLGASLLMVIFLWRWLATHMRPQWSLLDGGSEFRTTLAYGLPMVANEIAALILISLDRVMLKGLLGDFAAVGIYSIGYSLALQVSVLLGMSLMESFTPLANRAYETGGAAAVHALKAGVVAPVTYACIGVASAIWAVGPDVLVFLSGPSKAASGEVFQWAGAMYALYPIAAVCSFGLLLEKRTRKVFLITAIAAALNTILNFWLIPRIGYMGAVHATWISYLAMAIGSFVLCPRELRHWPEPKPLLLASVSGLMVIFAIHELRITSQWTGLPLLVAAFIAWVALYVAPLLAFDSKLRGHALRVFSRIAGLGR